PQARGPALRTGAGGMEGELEHASLSTPPGGAGVPVSSAPDPGTGLVRLGGTSWSCRGNPGGTRWEVERAQLPCSALARNDHRSPKARFPEWGRGSERGDGPLPCLAEGSTRMKRSGSRARERAISSFAWQLRWNP